MRTSITRFTVLALACGPVACGASRDADSIGSFQNALSSLTLNNLDGAQFTSGIATNHPPNGNQPDVCSNLGVRCEQFDLNIQLPSNVWHNAGGVQVAIRWATDDNAVNLYVYKGGVQVGKAEGFLAAISESLLLRSAENGTYRVYVALDAGNSLEPSVPFDAMARVQYDPLVNPVRPLLPDFAMRPQTTVTFDTPVFPFFGDVADPGQSCYHGEIEESGAVECMRFQQTFANVGEGAAELRFFVPKDLNDTSHDVLARTFYSDGSTTLTPAGTWEFHAAHQHYHYDNFVVSALWAADSKGRRLGTAPVRSGRKVSFCMEDERIDDSMWGQKGVRPRTYIAPNCLDFASEDALYKYIVQGLTPGWVDTYQWYLPGQYIDVNGLSSGDYVLETTADPDGKLVESNEDNNCGAIVVRLTNLGTQQHQAQIIGPGGGGCKK